MCYVNVNDGEESNPTQDGRQSTPTLSQRADGKWEWEANYSIKTQTSIFTKTGFYSWCTRHVNVRILSTFIYEGKARKCAHFWAARGDLMT